MEGEGVVRSYTYTPFRLTDKGGKRETKENARILNADLYKHSLFAAKLVTYFGPQTTKRVRAGVEFGNCIFFVSCFYPGEREHPTALFSPCFPLGRNRDWKLGKEEGRSHLRVHLEGGMKKCLHIHTLFGEIRTKG